MSHAGALDAAAIGERSAGQGCPLIGIKREGLRILFVSIDKQDSFVGDNIVLGSPGGQCPVLVSSLSLRCSRSGNHSCRDLLPAR